MKRNGRPTTRTDEGFTVAEMAVALIIFGVVSLIIFNFLDSTTGITARTTSDVRLEQDAQVALRQMTQDIRSANPIGSATASCGTLTYADCLPFTVKRPMDDPSSNGYGKCASAFVYRNTASVVKVDRTDSNCPQDRSVANRDVIVVLNSSSQPLFTYFDRLGKEIPIATPCTNSPTAPCVAQARAVLITLHASYQGQSGSLKLTSFASLRNNR